MNSRRFLFVGLAALAVAGPARAFVPADPHSLEFPLEYERARAVERTVDLADSFGPRSVALPGRWEARVSGRTGLIRMAYGSGFALPRAITGTASAEQAAREVLDLTGDLLGARPDNIALRNVATAPGKWAVHFKQVVDGVPVYRSTAFVLLYDGGQVAAFGSRFFPEDGGTVAPRARALSSAQALDAAAHALSAVPMPDGRTEAELLYVPAPDGETYSLRLAYRTVFRTDSPAGRWESLVDAADGTILARRNLDHTVNVTGTVQGDVEDFGICDGVGPLPMGNLRVNVSGGNNDLTDDTGAFDIVNAGSAGVTVTAQLLGSWCNVNRATGLGTDASFSGPATPGTPLAIAWTNSNSRADERDTFFHLNRVHDFMKSIDSGFTNLDYAMTATVGRSDLYCPGNAWWDGVGINLCNGSATYNNTGQLGNVIYHEYGHGVTQEVYQNGSAADPYGDLHEGNSDILANLIDRQPVIGLGFYTGNCTSGIRNSQNNLQYPEDAAGEGHAAGQVIAGFVWDTWQAMLAAYPQNVADDAIRQMWHLSRVLGTPDGAGGTGQQEQVDWSFLADDDDANLLNGTPHYDQLVVGASNHGFAYPLFGVVITHAPLASVTDGTAGFDIPATITSTAGSINASSVTLHYRLNGGSFIDVPMPATANPNEFAGHVAAIAGQSTEVEYYISASDIPGNSRLSPLGAPGDLYAFDVAYAHDDLESGSVGWTVGAAGDGATTGVWERVDPIGTQAQPEDDATPAPGVNCWVTGQCSGSLCTPCALGCNDIDGGITTLLSPVYDLSGAATAKVKYDRWYSNNTGAEPDADFWVVDVSNDGGTTWTNVENTSVSAAVWTARSVDINALFGTPGQVRLRFRASDTAGGSVVEAAVDEIRVLAAFGAVGVEEIAPVVASFSLSTAQPNPFQESTRIEFSLPRKADVSLAVFDVSGRSVRSLTRGTRDAGHYAVSWDGRDAAGRRVADGIYFTRLVSEGRTLTKKVMIRR